MYRNELLISDDSKDLLATEMNNLVLESNDMTTSEPKSDAKISCGSFEKCCINHPYSNETGNEKNTWNISNDGGMKVLEESFQSVEQNKYIPAYVELSEQQMDYNFNEVANESVIEGSSNASRVVHENDGFVYESVLFLSRDNICRAPMAVAILWNLIHRHNMSDLWAVNSSSLTDLHVGECIDARASKLLASYSISVSHMCQLVTKRDFEIYKYIFCMDREDLNAVRKWLPPGFDASKIMLLGSLHPDGPVELENPFFSADGDEVIMSLFNKIRACVTVFFEDSPIVIRAKSMLIKNPYTSGEPYNHEAAMSESDSGSESNEQFIEELRVSFLRDRISNMFHYLAVMYP